MFDKKKSLSLSDVKQFLSFKKKRLRHFIEIRILEFGSQKVLIEVDGETLTVPKELIVEVESDE